MLHHIAECNAKYVVIFVLLMLVLVVVAEFNRRSMLRPEQEAYVAVTAHRLADKREVGDTFHEVIHSQLLEASGDGVVRTEWGAVLPSPEVSLRLFEELAYLTPLLGKLGLELMKLTVDDYHGCWSKPYDATKVDYPRTHDARRKQPVVTHRYIWRELINPDIPTKVYLDHLCRAHACCNPTHLEPVTSSVNTRRGNDSRHILGGQDVLFHPD